MTIWTPSSMGRKGGRSRSPRKLAAVQANLDAAHKARRKPADQIQPASLKRRLNRQAKKNALNPR